MTQDTQTPEYTVYTDGGCLVNPGGPGGIGIVIISADGTKEISRGYRATTNNRMEMRAVLTALQALPEKCLIHIYSDSQYVINSLAGRWRKNKNTDLWALLDKEAAGRELDLNWVRGHAGDIYNERCDELASLAIENGPWEEDEGFSYTGSASAKGSGPLSIRIDIPSGPLSEIPVITDTEAFAKERGIKEPCARAIRDFYASEKKFSDYLDLKSFGQDKFSRIRKGDIEELCEKETVGTVLQYLPDREDTWKALRWYLRGLALEDAIRKVLVDSSVTDNAIRQNSKRKR